MSLLRATVKKSATWWELTLLDFDIVADGVDENSMLRDLEHSLVCEYHLAIAAGRPPFVNLLKECETKSDRSWSNGAKKFDKLNLPEAVSMALSMVGHMQSYTKIQVEVQEAKAA